WSQQNGAIYPYNSTVDLLIGGQSTASAKFAVIGVLGTNPTATLSGATGGSYLTSNGTLSTTNAQSLNLGSSSTGNLILNNNSFGVSTGNNAVLFAGAGSGIL